jgi:hypothetical protein
MAKDELFKGLSSILDKIYEKFLLRDIFAKIVPGLILIVTVFYVVTGDIAKIEKLTQLSWISWIILIGFEWIVAFGIQSIGEALKLIRYYTDNYDSDERWYIDYNKFLSKATPAEKSNCERFVVIKEATGNLSLSIFISTVLILIKLLLTDFNIIKNTGFWLISIFVFIFGVFLQRMHRVHVERQCKYVDEINNRA